MSIMDKAYYDKNIKEILQDVNTYSEIQNNQIKSTMRKIRKLLIKQHASSLTDKAIDYLENVEIKVSNLYGLP